MTQEGPILPPKHPLLRYFYQDLKWHLDHRVLILWVPKTLGMNSGQLKLPDTLQKITGALVFFTYMCGSSPFHENKNIIRMDKRRRGSFSTKKLKVPFVQIQLIQIVRNLSWNLSLKTVSQCNLSFSTWISLLLPFDSLVQSSKSWTVKFQTLLKQHGPQVVNIKMILLWLH